MNMQEGDSERDRPRRLTEPKEQDGTQSRRTETGGSPHPAHNRPDEWVITMLHVTPAAHKGPFAGHKIFPAQLQAGFYGQPPWPLGRQKSLNQVLGSLSWL